MGRPDPRPSRADRPDWGELDSLDGDAINFPRSRPWIGWSSLHRARRHRPANRPCRRLLDQHPSLRRRCPVRLLPGSRAGRRRLVRRAHADSRRRLLCRRDILAVARPIGRAARHRRGRIGRRTPEPATTRRGSPSVPPSIPRCLAFGKSQVQRPSCRSPSRPSGWAWAGTTTIGSVQPGPRSGRPSSHSSDGPAYYRRLKGPQSRATRGPPGAVPAAAGPGNPRSRVSAGSDDRDRPRRPLSGCRPGDGRPGQHSAASPCFTSTANRSGSSSAKSRASAGFRSRERGDQRFVVVDRLDFADRPPHFTDAVDRQGECDDFFTNSACSRCAVSEGWPGSSRVGGESGRPDFNARSTTHSERPIPSECPGETKVSRRR